MTSPPLSKADIMRPFQALPQKGITCIACRKVKAVTRHKGQPVCEVCLEKIEKWSK